MKGTVISDSLHAGHTCFCSYRLGLANIFHSSPLNTP